MDNNQISTSEDNSHLRGVRKDRLPRHPDLIGIPRNDRRRFETGQSLLEVIVAMTAGILVVAALTYAVIFSLRNANFAKTSSQATKLAQEGIERVKTGRDRNEQISNLVSSPDCLNVYSWNGDGINGAIWNCKIYNTCNGSGLNCYFKFTAPSSNNLTYLTSSQTLPVLAEDIPPMFKRAVILSDDATSFATQKKITVVVQWTDFSGPHQSMLTTILRKL